MRPRAEDLDSTENLIRSEAKRSLEFSKFAENRDSESKLRSISSHLGIDLDELVDKCEEDQVSV